MSPSFGGTIFAQVLVENCKVTILLKLVNRFYPVREHPLSTYAPRGRGGSKNLENMRTIVLIGCVKSVQEGGRGSKIPEILRTYFMDAPL